MKYLYLFQIGPVQSYIAAARRTQDLYVGSRLLSMLSSAGLQAANESGAQIVFPALLDDGRLPRSIPHRFAFISSAAIPENTARHVEKAIRDQWREVYSAVHDFIRVEIGGGPWEDTYDNQVRKWLEVYWVAVPYEETQHGQSYRAATVAMAMRRQARHFPQINEEGEKCTLTGAHSAVSASQTWWDSLANALGDSEVRKIIRPNERLGSIALIKRLAQYNVPGISAEEQRIRYFPDLASVARGLGYSADISDDDQEGLRYAILALDGDNMGEFLAGKQSLPEHQDVSRALADFAENAVPEIVSRYKGTLIYSGGDDVLAIMPIWGVLSCADELRRNIFDRVGVAASAGIAIVPVKFPLDAALDIARGAEHDAKEIYNRNCVVIRDAYRSGKMREMVGPWEITVPLASVIERLTLAFSRTQGWLSPSISYDVDRLAYAMDGPSGLLGARETELRRLLRRRVRAGTTPEYANQQIQELLPLLVALAEERPSGWSMLATWMILARTLAGGIGA